MKQFFVAKMYSFLSPNIIEKFGNKADAESYAALMSRTQDADYAVLEVVSMWSKKEEE